MSEDAASQTEDESEAPLDASFKVDSSALGDDEADFAKALGFGSEAPPPAQADAAAAEAEPGAVPPEAADSRDDEVEAAPSRIEADASAADAPPAPSDAGDADALSVGNDAASGGAPVAVDDETSGDSPLPVNDDAGDHEDEDEEVLAAAPGDAGPIDGGDDTDRAPDPDGGDWEAIGPRPAAEGMQDALQSHADEVLARPDDGTPFDSSPPSLQDSERASRPLGESEGRVAELELELSTNAAALASSRSTIESLERALGDAEAFAAQNGDSAESSAEHEKALEALRSEVDEAILERDQLVDQLAATSGHLVQSQARSEQLEASLRAARGALVPLPEGERALRAEVIGLRGRIDEAAQENVRLTGEVSSVATELAIAAARVEDRQHEIDFHAERAAALEGDNLEKDRQLQEAIERHRESLELATRLQAENIELRSTQAALEETLQARDLEITAREDHLRVTRDGLSARDEQIVDLREQLGQAQHRIESLEGDIERGEIERGVLAHKVERRESRIATLTRTLGRIEDAMGQRITPPETEGPPLARAEWTHLGGASVISPLAPVPAARGAVAPASASSLTTLPASDALHGEMTVEAFEHGEPAADADAAWRDAPIPRANTETLGRSINAGAAVETENAPSATEDEHTVDDVGLFLAPPPLPTILSRWRDRQVRDLDDALESVGAMLADQLLARLYDPPPEAIFLRSLGGSLPDAEVRWVQALQMRGLDGIRMDVLDANQMNAAARLQHIERAGLGELIRVQVGDLDDWNDEAPCHGILLADVLHAQQDVAALLERLSPQTARGALLFFVGRVGAGPVQLSASTLMRLEELWQLLPDSLAEAPGLGRPPFRGDDGGSPVPAQDASGVLQNRFAPLRLVGFGHLTDLVVGPARGFALSDDDADALQLLDAVGAIDTSRMETETLPPRHGIGVFAHDSADPAEIMGRPWAAAPRN